MKLKTIPPLFIPLLVLFACIVIAAVLGYYVFLAIGGKIDLDKIISKGALIFLILCTFPAPGFDRCYYRVVAGNDPLPRLVGAACDDYP